MFLVLYLCVHSPFIYTYVTHTTYCSNTALYARYRDLEDALEMGMDWSLREGYAWAEDKEHCEEYGRMLQADPSKVSTRAKKRGLPQVSRGCTRLVV